MTYATQADMEKRFDDLLLIADPDGDDAINVDRVVASLEDATATIDGYLEGKYDLPLTTIPKNIVGYACDIARYKLYNDDVPEQVETRFKDAMQYLRDLGRGVAQLSVAGVTASESSEILTSGPERWASDDSLSEF